MVKSFNISRVGHVAVHVTDVDRSVKWYTETLGLSVTGRWPLAGDGEIVFMRFDEDHHNIVLVSHPTEVTPESRDLGYNGLHHIAMEAPNRDEWLKALASLKRKGVEIVAGPLIHGPEGEVSPGRMGGGSGSRSFYFRDPDDNSLEIYTDMMKVPNDEPFPRPGYADVFRGSAPALANLPPRR